MLETQNYITLYEDNYFSEGYDEYCTYYKMTDNELIRAESFDKHPKLLFSDTYVNELMYKIKTSTKIIDVIIKNVILAYWGV